LTRQTLKNHKPWKSIEKLWKKGKKINVGALERDLKKTIADVRRGRKN